MDIVLDMSAVHETTKSKIITKFIGLRNVDLHPTLCLSVYAALRIHLVKNGLVSCFWHTYLGIR